ncbi:MAG: type II toxin-antitoxin system VapC family toxin [Candidatus Hydrogenedentes bacterium]|nr:type II toxin-antitoxin system VapC family toxin [Candidatus Hydrogenedentota bacterium]
MTTYFLDTGILLGVLRASPYAEYVLQRYAPVQAPNVSITSIVNEAELLSLAMCKGYGEGKQSKLADLLRRIPRVPIQHKSILRKWVEIDAFNQNGHPSLRLTGSHRKMGDNDIWIAATASVLRATLLTTDTDFNHLNGQFLSVVFISQRLTPADL